MADPAPNAAAGGGGAAAEAAAPDYTPEEATKCVKFVRAILREYGTSPLFFQDVQDAITDMDSLGEHYALRFAEKMKEIDHEWGIVDEEDAAVAAAAAVGERLPVVAPAPWPSAPPAEMGIHKATKVYEVIMPRTKPPTVRLVASHSSLRLAFSYVSERLGRGAIPPLVKADVGSASALRYMAMVNQARGKYSNVFFKNQDLEFMVIADDAKQRYVEGVHYVKG